MSSLIANRAHRRLLALAIGFLGWSSSAHAEREPASSDAVRLPTARTITAPRGTEGQIEVWEDSLLAVASAPSFHDVRVLDENGGSIPYALHPPRLEDWEWSIALRVTPVWSTEVVSGREVWETTLNLPRAAESQPGTSRMRRLLVTPGTRVTVRDMDEGHDLRMLFPHECGVYWPGVLAEFGSKTRSSVPIVSVSTHTETVRFRRTHPPEPDLEILLVDESRRDSPRIHVPFQTANARFERDGVWQCELRTGETPWALCELRYDLRFPDQDPKVRIDLERLDGTWVSIPPRASGLTDSRIQRAPSLESKRSRRLWDPVRAHRIRVHVSGADAPNPPIENLQLLATPARIRIASSESPAELLYGDPFLDAPGWNLRPNSPLDAQPGRAELGPEYPNPVHQLPGFGLDWLRRRPAVLSGIMLGLLILLVVIAWRSRAGSADGSSATDGPPV